MGLIAGMQGQVNIKNQCELSYKFKKKIVQILNVSKCFVAG